MLNVRLRYGNCIFVTAHIVVSVLLAYGIMQSGLYKPQLGIFGTSLFGFNVIVRRVTICCTKS